jgi:hypothetical protein
VTISNIVNSLVADNTVTVTFLLYRGHHDRTPCRAVHRFYNLLNLLQRVLVGLLGSLAFRNLDAVRWIGTL